MSLIGPPAALICTKDVSGRKMITITNTLADAHFPREVSI